MGFQDAAFKIYPLILVTLFNATLSHTWNTAMGTTQQIYVPQLCFKCYDTSWGKGFGEEMLFIYLIIESCRPKCFAVSALCLSVTMVILYSWFILPWN